MSLLGEAVSLSQFGPELGDVAHGIQLSVAPVFLLAGIGAFLNVCAGRLARVVDRTRQIEPQLLVATDAQHDRLLDEMRLLDRRIAIINRAILASVVSATLVCMLIILLFAAQMAGVGFNRTIALFFIAALAALAASYILFIVEVRLASRSLRVAPALLQHAPPDAET